MQSLHVTTVAFVAEQQSNHEMAENDLSRFTFDDPPNNDDQPDSMNLDSIDDGAICPGSGTAAHSDAVALNDAQIPTTPSKNQTATALSVSH